MNLTILQIFWSNKRGRVQYVKPQVRLKLGTENDITGWKKKRAILLK